ncbi:MAG: SEC-C domain-containing protein [Myxococcaceae bacterium]|nr:SEC-C domain-containing protein [Myxococcaceae bacterium]
MPPCPCGGPSLERCCGPRLDGSAPAPTAEALMRSRYSAFALGRGDYLAATQDAPATAEELTRAAREGVWVGLTVLATAAGGAQDERGEVEFEARCLEGATLVRLRERSRFRRAPGWRYEGGTPSVTREKLERNAPCPCGSGKKLKKCHLG